jgi:hypothetical protein
MAVTIPDSMSFRACIYHSEGVPGNFVAHCLELDLIGEGVNPLDAIKELTDAIEIQLESCTTLSQVFFPAPDEIWKKYKQNAERAILKRIILKARRTTPSTAYRPNFEKITATSSVPKEYVQA